MIPFLFLLLRGLATVAALSILTSPGLAPEAGPPAVGLPAERGSGRTVTPVRPAPARTVSLVVVAPEPVLSDGRVQVTYLRRAFPLELTSDQQAQVLNQKDPEPAAAPVLALFRQIEARVPQDARFFLDADDTWTARARTGWTVDRAATLARLRQALKGGQGEVRVTVKLTPPGRTVRQLAAAGVLRHIGSGTSDFSGSPDFRVHNIRVGSGRLSGMLLKPGAVLDFNRMVGAINARQGFVPGYVIAGNTLSLEDGGGICQVSTTLFRAAYNAGLEIVERHAHSHQVSYYDPPGFEATVYAPNLNLRVRNDTAGGLLVQASWDLNAQTLRFNLFGTRQREVSVSAPRMSRIRPATPPSFMVGPALSSGQTVRVDMPSQGADVQIERRIVDPDGTVRRDVTRSTYRPWGGVFAVHASDLRLKR